MNFNRYLEIARALYEFDFEHRCQHFSFLVYKNRIISAAKNSIKTNPQSFKRQIGPFLPGSCSEFRAIKKIKNLTNLPLNKMTLFNVRINRRLEFCLSYPCPSCCQHIQEAGLKRVYFTNESGG